MTEAEEGAFAPGAGVMIAEGPFQGREGTVERVDRLTDHVWVRAEFNGRRTLIEIEGWMLDRVHEPR